MRYASRNRIPESEVWLDRYLREHGYDPGDPEPDLGVSKRPDRLIERRGQRVVCEIKQFERGIFAGRSGRSGSLLPRDVLKPIGAVKEAADQLRPLQDTDYPLVVVLANPKNVDVSLEVSDVVHALYGDPSSRFMIDTATGRPVGDVEFFAGRNGRLRNFHQYISAVVVLRHRTNAQDWADEGAAELLEGRAEPRTLDEATELATQFLESSVEAEDRGDVPDGDYLYVDAIETISPDAVPLPDDFFDGPRDSRYAFDAAGEVFNKASCRAHSPPRDREFFVKPGPKAAFEPASLV